LEIAFETRSLRSICESEGLATRELGQAVAESLRRRLADLRAATSTADLLVGNPREYKVDSSTMMLDLSADHRLVFTANHPTNPETEAGAVDWSKISRVKILRIEHEND
jgi:hypothetical protein